MFVHQNYDRQGPQGEYECVRPTPADVVELIGEGRGSDRCADGESRLEFERKREHD